MQPPDSSPIATPYAPVVEYKIPFGQSHKAAPGSLGYGFGMSAATRFASPLVVAPTPTTNTITPGGWRGGLSWGGAVGGSAGGFGGIASANERRRRRSETPDSEEENVVQTQRSGKKPRTGEIVVRDSSEGNGAIELGKAIAGLSKESLVTLLKTLYTTTPTLVPLLTSLLPPPTLSNTLSTILQLERKILTALPSGLTVREDYIWGRVKVPLEDYLEEARGMIRGFCVEGGGGGGGEDEIGHSSTTFAFLYALTSSLRRIEATLPSPPSLVDSPNYPLNKRRAQDILSTTLLPLLSTSWSTFLALLSAQVNQQGRIISSEVLKGWLKRLEELSVESPGVREGTRREGGARAVVLDVETRMRREVGWLVGLKDPGGGEEMEEEL